MTLALVGAFSSLALAGKSQPDPASNAVRALAADDVRNETGRRTQEAVAFAKQQWPNADSLELRAIYDDEYTRRFRDKPVDLAKELKRYWPGYGLLALFFVGLGAVLNEMLKKWVLSALVSLGNRLYARLAGSKFLRALALRRYRAALIGSLRWLKVTFRPGQPLDMREVYVPLRIAGSTSAAPFDVCEVFGQHRRLMVTGAPGSGKSVLLRHIAYAHAEGRSERLPDDPIPVLLELHRLKREGLNVEKLVAELVAALARSDFPKAEGFLLRALDHGSIILLFDGLDEVAPHDRATVVRVIQDTLTTYRNCRAVITCRSAVYHDEMLEAVDQTLEIAELSDQQIRRFLRSWMREVPPGKSVEELVQTLRDRPLIMSLARNPLMLTILAYLYTDTPFVLPHSRVEFYDKAIHHLLGLRDEERAISSKYRADDKRRVLQYVALAFQDQASADASGDHRSLDSAVVRTRVQQLLPSLNLPPEGAQSLLDEIAERSGLLLCIDNGQRYQFAHLTIQEYFAAGALKDTASEMLAQFGANPGAWREPAKLWCGLAGNATSFLVAVREFDPLMAVECLADAAEVDDALANAIVDEAQRKLHLLDETAAYAAAMGNLAASPRPRGRRVLDFLVESIWRDTSLLLRDMATLALSRSNLPAAAQALSHCYVATRNGALLDALVRMGDVAVPCCAQLVKAGHLELLETLGAIGTPDAARALADLLWSGKPSAVSVRAAVKLAALLPQSAIEEELGTYPLTAEQRLAETLEWIWSPFEVSSDSSLPIIAGRIGHLVGNATLDELDARLGALDPRIIVPLCAIQLHDDLRFAEHWNNGGDALTTEGGTNCDLARQEHVRHVLGVMPERSLSHGLLSSLAPRLESELLRRLKVYRKPRVDDWRHLFDRVEYAMRTGWHYWTALALALLLTLGALGEVPLAFWAHARDWRVAASLIFCTWSMLLSWFVFWKGGQKVFDPDVFSEAGLRGPHAFFSQTARLMGQRTVGTVGDVVLRAFHDVQLGSGASGSVVVLVVAGSLAVAVGGAVTGGVTGTVDLVGVLLLGVGESWLAFIGLSVGVLLVLTVAGAVVVAEARARAAAVASVLWIGTFPVILGSMAWGVAGIGVVAVPQLLLGLGLGAWLRAATDKVDGWRYLAIFAFPFFCWLPVTIALDTLLALRVHMSPIAIVAGWLAVALGVTALLRRGRTLENRARNPLRDILSYDTSGR